VSDIPSQRSRFPGISSRAYEHPADQAALVALRKIPGIDTAINKINGLYPERLIRMDHLSMAVRTSPRQFSRLHAILREAADVLDLDRVPEMYVRQGLGLNAMTIGTQEPIIVLSADLIDLMDLDELRFVIGHELGHAMSGHSLYRTIAWSMVALGSLLSSVPLGTIGLHTVQSALAEWSRKAELSSDRAGLLVTQDRNSCLRALMKLAGGIHLEDMNVEEFLAQAAEFSQAGDIRDSIIRMALTRDQSHPLLVMRVAELDRWAAGPEYASALAGHYVLRGDDATASLALSARQSVSGYQGTIAQSAAPVLSSARDLGVAVRQKSKGMIGPVRRRIGQNRPPEAEAHPPEIDAT
jgi:Zn-dependent protease with chaperone function